MFSSFPSFTSICDVDGPNQVLRVVYHPAMKIGNPPRSGWRNFPDVLMHAHESAVKKHADYPAAKTGDISSARRVVEAALNDSIVKALGSIASSSNPVLASVHAYEAQGINRIPAVFAEVLAERLGLRAETDAAQIDRQAMVGQTDAFRRNVANVARETWRRT